MKIQVRTREEEREVETEAKTVKELLEELDINPVSHVVSLNGELAIEEDKLSEKDKLKIQSVVSGG